ncbi:hypothetical protein EJ110_NYTH30476 [Nymphaea thermarum]|nr:hypothetical protein EJ110_NYTH30476 [Nymphaea thermarum]
MRGKWKQPVVSQSREQSTLSQEISSLERFELDSSGNYSPMDFSPYRETSPCDFSRSTSAVSGESVCHGVDHVSKDFYCVVPSDEVDRKMDSSSQPLCSDEGVTKEKLDNLIGENVKHYVSRSTTGPMDSNKNDTWRGSGDNHHSASRAENEWLDSKITNLDVESERCMTSSESNTLGLGNLEKYDKKIFSFASTMEPKFAFAAPQPPFSAKSHPGRKFQTTSSKNACRSTSSVNSQMKFASVMFPLADGGIDQATINEKEVSWHQNSDASVSHSLSTNVKSSVNHELMSSASGTPGEYGSKVSIETLITLSSDAQCVPKSTATASLEACEKWRLSCGSARLAEDDNDLPTDGRGRLAVVDNGKRDDLPTDGRGRLFGNSAGNEAFQAGRHAEAVEHYTSALAYNIESRPFAAICFANRAAAYQALNQITDAIAYCSLVLCKLLHFCRHLGTRMNI